jgi:DNA-binding MarR family transcriptional regulator
MMTLCPDKEGDRFLALGPASEVLGATRMAVSMALNRLEKAGVITFTKEHTFNRSRRWRFTEAFKKLNLSKAKLVELGYASDHTEGSAKGKLQQKASQLLSEGVAVSGNFNDAEKKITGSAIAYGLDYAILLEVVSDCWPGWATRARQKRLHHIFKWVIKREAKNGRQGKKEKKATL